MVYVFQFKKFVENLLEVKIKALQVNMGNEYKLLTQFLNDIGIML